MTILELSAVGLLVSVVANLLKVLVDKYGALVMQLTVLALSIIAAFTWTYWGKTYDWSTVISIWTLAISIYEVILKRFWTGK